MEWNSAYFAIYHKKERCVFNRNNRENIQVSIEDSRATFCFRGKDRPLPPKKSTNKNSDSFSLICYSKEAQGSCGSGEMPIGRKHCSFIKDYFNFS